MPGRSGEPVVTMLVCFVFYCMRGCGCIKRPVFPAPSLWRARNFLANLGHIKPRDREAVFEISSSLRKQGPITQAAIGRRDDATRAIPTTRTSTARRMVLPHARGITIGGCACASTRWPGNEVRQSVRAAPNDSPFSPFPQPPSPLRFPSPAAMKAACLRGAPLSALAARLPPEHPFSARPGSPSDSSATPSRSSALQAEPEHS
jgi:hypothetical protein